MFSHTGIGKVSNASSDGHFVYLEAPQQRVVLDAAMPQALSQSGTVNPLRKQRGNLSNKGGTIR